MNKYARWLALLLIRLEIRKFENKALKRMRKGGNYTAKRRVEKLVDYLTAGNQTAVGRAVGGRTYQEWLMLKHNIEGINGPWTGFFAPVAFWTRGPKDEKHIEPFPEYEPSVWWTRAVENRYNKFDDGLGNDLGNLTQEELDKWLEAIDKEAKE